MKRLKHISMFAALWIGLSSAANALDTDVPLDAVTYKDPFNTLVTIEVPQVQNVTLSSGSMLRLKVLIPPGVSSAGIFGTSNDFIGMGADPVMATFIDKIPAPCDTGIPVDRGGSSGLMCGTTGLNTSSTLSLSLYSAVNYGGEPVKSARYAYFVLYNPAANTRSLTFRTVRVTMEFSKPLHETMYKTWRNARPWAGLGGTGTWDGVGEDYSRLLPPPSCNKTKSASVNSAIGINIPYLDMSGLGLPHSGLEVQLRMLSAVNPGDTVVIIDSLGNRKTLPNPGLFLWSLDSSLGSNAAGFDIPGLKGCTP